MELTPASKIRNPENFGLGVEFQDFREGQVKMDAYSPRRHCAFRAPGNTDVSDVPPTLDLDTPGSYL